MIFLNIFIFLIIKRINGFILNENENDSALYLTPFIENGRIEYARQLSEVKQLPNANDSAVKSYSGLLTVDSKYNSNLFFWFFPAFEKAHDAPVILWLDGGPGISGLFSVFSFGPFILSKNLEISLRNHTLLRNYSMIFIDNPVGTGFSFTKNNNGYANYQNDVSRDLYHFIKQFLTIFYEYKDNDLYIGGNSNGGRFTASFGYKIHSEGPKSDIKLKGVILESSPYDPINMIDFGNYLFHIGIIDQKINDYFQRVQKRIKLDITLRNYSDAYKRYDILFNGLYTNITYFTNVTGITYLYNYLYTDEPEDLNYYQRYAVLPDTRRAIHTDNLDYNDYNMIVAEHLIDDRMRSVKSCIETLLNNNYKILIYNGQLDINVPPVFSERSVNRMNWKYRNEFENVNRKIWRDANRNVLGYIKKYRNFNLVSVRDAGHFVACEKPEIVYHLICQFINNKL